ncbi:flagellar hook-associated protein 3 [Acidobacteria bacterium AB60]|nr:flagellar hook-associated protein 3 [Acidobacteria bacterium AB60]
MRINPNLVPDVLAGIQQSEQALQTAETQVATGKRVARPSDDPSASAAMVGNVVAQGQVDQYTQNVSSVLAMVQTADTSLSSVVTSLTQAVTLGTEGANGTVNSKNQQAIAQEVQGILQSVLSQANMQYQGVYLFGGTANTTVPFTASSTSPSGYAYNGSSNVNSVAIGDQLNVPTGVAGNQIFSNASGDVLGSLANLVTALQGGNTTAIGNATSAVSAALDNVNQQRVTYGNIESQLNAQDTYLQHDSVNLQSQQTSLVGVDMAKAATALSQAEIQNQAALAAAAKVLPNTLLSYLK